MESRQAFIVRLLLRLPPNAQRVNIQIVKGAVMEPVKQTERESSPILCPVCFRRSNYLFSVDLYACPIGHGVVITGEELLAYYEEARA
jgi:hypothetical protein